MKITTTISHDDGGSTSLALEYNPATNIVTKTVERDPSGESTSVLMPVACDCGHEDPRDQLTILMSIHQPTMDLLYESLGLKDGGHHPTERVRSMPRRRRR